MDVTDASDDIEPAAVHEIRLEPTGTHDDCPVCLQVLFCPVVLQPCGHHYCEQCWQRVVDAASYEERKPACPVCRSEPANAALDSKLDDKVKERHPDEWHVRLRQRETERQIELSCARRAEMEAAALAAASAEIDEAEEETSADGRVTRRMTAGLIYRCAKEQGQYRTATLASRLELTLLRLRDVSPALAQYSMLTSLHLEHNSLESLEGLGLQLLKVRSHCLPLFCGSVRSGA